LDRPSKVGDKAALEYVYALLDTSTTTWQGRDPQTKEQELGAHLICDIEIKDVDDRGQVLAEELTVRKCTSLKGKDEVELLPEGTKLIARVKDKSTLFLVNGSPASDNVRQALGCLLWLYRSKDAPSIDAQYGTTSPRKIGESWPIDAKLTCADLASNDAQVDPDDVSGTVTTKSLEKVNGQDCVRVEAETDVKHLKSKDRAQRGEMTLKDTSEHYHMTWLSPLDLSKDIPSAVYETTRQFTWTGSRNGLSYQIDQQEQSELDCRILEK
jgi:hypothetical protein